MNLSLQEQLVALYGHFPRQKFDKNEGFDKLLYDSSRRGEYFFKRVRFDTDRGIYSPDIEEANSNLVSAGLLCFLTTNLSSPVIDPAMAVLYEGRLKSTLRADELKELEKIAKKFKRVANVRDIFA